MIPQCDREAGGFQAWFALAPGWPESELPSELSEFLLGCPFLLCRATLLPSGRTGSGWDRTAHTSALSGGMRKSFAVHVSPQGVSLTAQRAAIVVGVELPVYDITKKHLILSGLMGDTVATHFLYVYGF
jgi:hypothetical protein